VFGFKGKSAIMIYIMGIPIKIEILIPGVAMNSNKHKWVAFLEKQNSEGINALIIGQEWLNEHCSWSRYIEVTNNDSCIGSGWFKIIDNTFMGPKYDFKSLIIFMEVLSGFSETI
jgi:hypothetical protein